MVINTVGYLIVTLALKNNIQYVSLWCYHVVIVLRTQLYTPHYIYVYLYLIVA